MGSAISATAGSLAFSSPETLFSNCFSFLSLTSTCLGVKCFNATENKYKCNLDLPLVIQLHAPSGRIRTILHDASAEPVQGQQDMRMSIIR